VRRLILVAVTALALLAAIVPAAMARGRDANRDRIPDKWERHHHLSLKVKQTRRDQDKDGLTNLREFRNHTDPRDADSDDDGLDDADDIEHGDNPNDDDTDDDGIQDDDENAGTVDSFDATTGLLVIKLAKDGSLVSGTVTSGTEIECEGAPTATASHDGDGDSSGPGSGDDDQAGDDNSGPGSTNSGDDDANDDHGDDDQGDEDEHDCGTAALVQGAVVHEAELVTTSAGATWREVELHTS
jgi:hypothetical protein